MLVALWAKERRRRRSSLLAREKAGRDAGVKADVAEGVVACGGNAKLAVWGALPRKALVTCLLQLSG